MTPKEVFLSHSSVDQATADRVSATLTDYGIPVWYSSTNIRTADQWLDAIGSALRRCDWFIVLLLPAFVDSKWVRMELSYALRHSQYDNHVLPVKIEECDHEKLSWTLGGFQMASLDGDPEQGYADILRTWMVDHERDLTPRGREVRYGEVEQSGERRRDVAP